MHRTNYSSLRFQYPGRVCLYLCDFMFHACKKQYAVQKKVSRTLRYIDHCLLCCFLYNVHHFNSVFVKPRTFLVVAIEKVLTLSNEASKSIVAVWNFIILLSLGKTEC